MVLLRVFGGERTSPDAVVDVMYAFPDILLIILLRSILVAASI